MKDKIYRWMVRKFPKKLLYFCVIKAWALSLKKVPSDTPPNKITYEMVCNYLGKGEY